MAAGIARHLGLSGVVVRLAFVALVLADGVGIAMYAAFWLLLPQSGLPSSDPAGARAAGQERVRLVALAAVVVGALLLLQSVGLFSPVLLPLGLAGVGVARSGSRRKRRSERGGAVRAAAAPGCSPSARARCC